MYYTRILKIFFVCFLYSLIFSMHQLYNIEDSLYGKKKCFGQQRKILDGGSNHPLLFNYIP